MDLRWEDLTADTLGGAWAGLSVYVTAAARPIWHRRTRDYQIALLCGVEPILLARVHRYYYGHWRLLGQRQASWHVVTPIKSGQIQGQPLTPHWWRYWCIYFAEQLAASTCTPLYKAKWLFAPIPAFRHEALSPLSVWSQMRHRKVYYVEECLDTPTLAWESWWTSGSGALIPTRHRSTPDAARVRYWRKLARDGSLPPLLAEFDSGLDVFLLVDGHDRLAAAMLEGSPVPVVAFCPVREYRYSPDVGRQHGVMTQVARDREGKRKGEALATERANELLISAFDSRPILRPRSRAWPLDLRWWMEMAHLWMPSLRPEHAFWTETPPAATTDR